MFSTLAQLALAYTFVAADRQTGQRNTITSSATPVTNSGLNSDPPPPSSESDGDFKAIYHMEAQHKQSESTGPELYPQKEARPAFDPKVSEVWGRLGLQIAEHLDSAKVPWTTIGLVRLAEIGGNCGPPVLRIGVKPGTLSCKLAKGAAVRKKLLTDFNLHHVGICLRESGPQLLDSVPSSNVTAGLRGPLTPALGLCIARRDSRDTEDPLHTEGSSGIYIRESAASKRVFLLTARHVVLPPADNDNKSFDGQPRVNVFLGNGAVKHVLESTKEAIETNESTALVYRNKIKHFRRKDVQQAESSMALLGDTEHNLDDLRTFSSKITENWQSAEHFLGHVASSPAIGLGVGPEGFTEDWALVELDGKMINWDTFNGNVIDLGTELSKERFEEITNTTYPKNRLLSLSGFVGEHELRNPTTFDGHGERCHVVIKNGARTGVTIGRTDGVESFVREYDKITLKPSRELAVLGYEGKAFSEKGDSGAIVADPRGRIVGLITGGSGVTASTDTTYITPFYWLFNECIRKKFPDAVLY